MTPLHFAAQRGRYNLVGYLVGKDADVNAKDLNEVRLNGNNFCIVIESVFSHATERGYIYSHPIMLLERKVSCF